jgi:hypothetical protein
MMSYELPNLLPGALAFTGQIILTANFLLSDVIRSVKLDNLDLDHFMQLHQYRNGYLLFVYRFYHKPIITTNEQ